MVWLVARLRASADCIQPSCMECVCVVRLSLCQARLMHSLVDVLCRDRETWQRARCAQHPTLLCTAETHVLLCESSLLTLLGPALIPQVAQGEGRRWRELQAHKTNAQNVGPRVCKFITLEVASLSRVCGGVLVAHLQSQPRCVPWLQGPQCAATPANALQDSHRHLRDLDTWLVVACASSHN